MSEQDQIVDDVLADIGLKRSANTPERSYPLEHGIKGPFCPHAQSVVDQMARVVTCRKCGVALDPIDVLVKIALDPTWIKHARQERRMLEEQTRALRVEVSKLKAAKRRAT